MTVLGAGSRTQVVSSKGTGPIAKPEARMALLSVGSFLSCQSLLLSRLPGCRYRAPFLTFRPMKFCLRELRSGGAHCLEANFSS